MSKPTDLTETFAAEWKKADHRARVEAWDALYYRRFHRLAPGRSEARELGIDSSDDENRVQCDAWHSSGLAGLDAIMEVARLQAVEADLRMQIERLEETNNDLREEPNHNGTPEISDEPSVGGAPPAAVSYEQGLFARVRADLRAAAEIRDSVLRDDPTVIGIAQILATTRLTDTLDNLEEDLDALRKLPATVENVALMIRLGLS